MSVDVITTTEITGETSLPSSVRVRQSRLTPTSHTWAAVWADDGAGLNRLSAIKVARLKAPGYYADGGNLYLRIAPGGSKGWMFRFAIAGRTRDAGLGSYPAVSLVKARQKAERHRHLVGAGVDPIEARRKERDAELLASSKALTFEQCAKAYIAAHDPSWTNEKHKYQWRANIYSAG